MTLSYSFYWLSRNIYGWPFHNRQNSLWKLRAKKIFTEFSWINRIIGGENADRKLFSNLILWKNLTFSCLPSNIINDWMKKGGWGRKANKHIFTICLNQWYMQLCYINSLSSNIGFFNGVFMLLVQVRINSMFQINYNIL